MNTAGKTAGICASFALVLASPVMAQGMDRMTKEIADKVSLPPSHFPIYTVLLLAALIAVIGIDWKSVASAWRAWRASRRDRAATGERRPASRK
ncbi:hypothetical protein [Aminobacter sp. MSH1]|uniref:hypothetical protein n=1 Tax=Aminobacter sp. MSH1 TaxID=374606 RepID=UPI000D3B3DDA|nr:hypothetical protein [Aminobacter sp. MSH1]